VEPDNLSEPLKEHPGMTTTTLTPRPVGSIDWDVLRAAVDGRLITPADADWQQARMAWQVNVDQQPAAVLEVANVSDVVTAVRWAIEAGVSVTAQPSGHAARTTLDNTLLIRTRALRVIAVDVEERTATVGAGVKFGELMSELDDTGLIALCGSNPDPSVVGLLLGGGVSWFTRAHGFTANSVLSVDLVNPAGELVHVTQESDPELFWALRGGGGDFGIVVRVELRLYPAPELYGGQLMWSIEDAPKVLKAFRDLALVAPRELTLWAHIMHFPDMEDIPAPMRGRSFVNVTSTYIGSAKMAEILLWSLRDAAPVVIDLMDTITPGEVGDVAAEPTDPMPVMESSMLLTSLDDEAIDALVAAVGDRNTCPLAVVQIRGLGGAFAEEPALGGAVRTVVEPFNVFALGVPAVPELAAAIPHGFAALDAAVGHLSSGRRMPNFTGHGQADSGGYDNAGLQRLRSIKLRRDPLGVIRSNKPVLGH
jgi:hypothetical protein